MLEDQGEGEGGGRLEIQSVRWNWSLTKARLVAPYRTEQNIRILLNALGSGSGLLVAEVSWM